MANVALCVHWFVGKIRKIQLLRHFLHCIAYLLVHSDNFYPEQNAKIEKNWKNASSRKSRSLLAKHRNHATCLFGDCSWYTRATLLIVCWANKMWAGTVSKCCCDQHSLTMRAVKSSQVWCRAIQIHQRSLTSKCRWSKRIRLESSPRQISATSRSNSHKREWICGSCTVTNVGSLRRQCLLVQTLPSTKCRDSLKTNQQAPTLEWVAQNWPRRKLVLAAECRQVKIIWTRQPNFEFDHWFSAQPAPLRGGVQAPGGQLDLD